MAINKYERFIIIRETRTRGYVADDGGDSRETTTELLIIPERQEETYEEDIAEEYGNQDYSYQFDSKKIAAVTGEELQQMRKIIYNLIKEI